MTCFLCGSDDGHHLGCFAAHVPDLTPQAAFEAGLIAAPKKAKAHVPDVVEILPEGSMTTVPEAQMLVCAIDGCDNPKYSDSPRAKYCGEHKDPKSRKE